jgi:2-dehydro-3-deoxyphosphogluconate aldolase/(4S)-4-hydroxy-2-oxoglutarate aldolase
MNKKSVCEQIASIGIIPIIRASSSEEARFAAEAVWSGGIPLVEITMTVPGALQVISGLAKTMPNLLIGAGTVLNKKMARQCSEAGAQFLVSPGFDAGMVATAKKFKLVVIAGALTPTEVMAAWDAGADFVKVFPCCNLGGPAIKASGPFPQSAQSHGWRNDRNRCGYIRWCGSSGGINDPERAQARKSNRFQIWPAALSN